MNRFLRQFSRRWSCGGWRWTTRGSSLVAITTSRNGKAVYRAQTCELAYRGGSDLWYYRIGGLGQNSRAKWTSVRGSRPSYGKILVTACQKLREFTTYFWESGTSSEIELRRCQTVPNHECDSDASCAAQPPPCCEIVKAHVTCLS